MNQVVAQKRYADLLNELESLIDKYEDNYDVEYVEDMKPSIEKSLQLFFGRFTSGRAYRRFLESQMSVPNDLAIKRKEIEEELIELLKLTKSHADVESIKDIIFDEQGNDDMQEIIMMFDDGDPNNLSNVLETVSDAWNYFPHKALGGLSPAEKLSKR